MCAESLAFIFSVCSLVGRCSDLVMDSISVWEQHCSDNIKLVLVGLGQNEYESHSSMFNVIYVSCMKIAKPRRQTVN